MYRTFRHIPVLIFLGLLTACGSDNPTTTPTDTVPLTVTETFSGTVTANGATTHPFATRGGTVTATLTTLSPDSASIVGLTLGTWNGQDCQSVISNDRATQGSVIIGTASTTGNLCVRLYDATGALPQPTDYEVQVVHTPT